MPRDEVWGVLIPIDVGRYDTIEVSPANNETKTDTTLIYSYTLNVRSNIIDTPRQKKKLTFGIVAGPRYRIWYTWIDAHCPEKRPRIPYPRGLGSEKHTEPSDSNE